MKKALLVFLLLSSVLLFPALLFSSGVDTYCYEQLNMAEQMAYEAIQDCLTHLISRWNSGSFSQNTIQKAYNCFLMDHPEVYWSKNPTYIKSFVNNVETGHHLEFSYSMDAAQIQKTNSEIEMALYDIIAQLPSLDASYETVKGLYDWMMLNCTYDELNLDQSMYSVMVNHSGVCASLSKAFQFIMQCLGIPCTVVNGRIEQSYTFQSQSSDLGHEWNMVCLDGKWYHVDITSGLSLTKDSGEIDYSFLCATTEEVLKSHTIANEVPIPQSTDTSLNFYKRYGLEITTYSRDAVYQAFKNSLALGRKPVVKFTNYRAFSQAIDDLFTNQGIFEVLKALTTQDYRSLNYQVEENAMIIKIDI